VSSFDHLVTQWMSVRIVSLRRDLKSSQSHVFGSETRRRWRTSTGREGVRGRTGRQHWKAFHDMLAGRESGEVSIPCTLAANPLEIWAMNDPRAYDARRQPSSLH
jgi:hypothetical protein